MSNYPHQSRSLNPFWKLCRRLLSLVSIEIGLLIYVFHLMNPDISSDSVIKLPKSTVNSDCEIGVYLSIEAENRQSIVLAKSFLKEFQLSPTDKFKVDRVGKQESKWFPTKNQDTTSISQVSIEDKSVPFKKLVNIAQCKQVDEQLTAFIITTGTTNPIALKQISAAIEQLLNYKNLRIYVIGLNLSNRSAMYDMVKSLRTRIKFLDTNPQEWLPFIKASHNPIKKELFDVTTTKK
jgi:hypothetical protein